MRILHIIDHMGLGGAQNSLRQLMETDYGDEYFHCYVLRRTTGEQLPKHPNLKLYNSTSRYSPGPLWSLAAYVRENDIRVLHSHLFRSHVFAWFVKRFLVRDVQFVLHERSQIYAGNPFYRPFLRLARDRIDRVIPVSRAIRDTLVEEDLFPAEQMKVLHNFVNAEEYEPARDPEVRKHARRRFKLQNDEFAVGFAGRIVRRKGWREFLSMAERLVESDDSYRFLIAGDGPEREELESEVDNLDISPHVQIPGRVDDMVSFYSALDCFVLPSHFEGLPNVQLEAMAAGVPLVTTTGPGMDEVPDGSCAILCEVGDSRGLSEAVKTLRAGDSLRNNLVKKATIRVGQNDVGSYVQQLTEIYQTL